MNIPTKLQAAIDQQAAGKDSKKMRDHVANICRRYLYDSGQGKKLVEASEEVLAYAVSRMPATYCAVYSALEHLLERYPKEVKSLTDVGSGTGAVCWAANELFELSEITCVEREQHMIDLAKSMMSENKDMKDAVWIHADAVSSLKAKKSDLVTASYIMNELKESEKTAFLENLWNCSKDVILVIEPGTTAGCHDILIARDYFIKKGASILAPCTHHNPCPLEKEEWCHFSCRVQRNKLQKYVKYGDAPYEDEKYSYIIVTKNEIEETKLERIIAHPASNKGYTDIKVCSAVGIREIRISSRDKAAYKAVRKAEWGDAVSLIPETAPAGSIPIHTVFNE